ncbi:hypothetical protein BCR44DRAFT_35926 [Catenaria anguillulae PL171]|uniref:Uncharacterized protein n=1 Tax=Catenaria anguillulae PL171 TaxID=765915 RepID=A0A1Y2HHF3_9FUNG|nr:hypothetical protein BCR44DRAFT_35926 [Catenaria anguillulae PL171]
MWCPGASGAGDGLGRCISGQCQNVTGRWIVGEAASGQLVNGTPVFPLPTNTNSTSTPTDSATNPPTQPADGSQGASAAVIGGAVGGVAAVGAASGALVWFKWYRVRSLGMAAANSGSMALMSVGNMAGRTAGA